jgi:hypothetical protein
MYPALVDGVHTWNTGSKAHHIDSYGPVSMVLPSVYDCHLTHL